MTSTSSQRFSRAEPGTFVWASSSIERDRRLPRDDRVGVHLLDDDAAVLDPPARHDLEAVEQLDRVRPPVRLDEADHEVRAARRAGGAPPRASGRSCRRRAPCRGRRAAGRGRRRPRRGRARASRRPSGRTSNASRSGSSSRSSRSSPSRSRLSSRTLTRGSPRNPSSGCSVCRATTARTSASVMPRAAATRATWYSAAGRADVRVEPGRRGRDEVDRDRRVRRSPPGRPSTLRR